jgi:hypothetical protein
MKPPGAASVNRSRSCHGWRTTESRLSFDHSTRSSECLLMTGPCLRGRRNSAHSSTQTFWTGEIHDQPTGATEIKAILIKV